MNKKKNKGCGSWIFGTLLVLVGVVAYVLLLGLLNRICAGIRLGDSVACELLTFSVTGTVIAFIIYEIIFITWQIKLDNVGGESENKTKQLFRTVLVVGICLSLLMAIVSANTCTELREDSFSKVCFVEYKSYRVENVYRYTLSCDANGNLSYTLTMRDGEKIELFDNVNSCSNEFVEKHSSLYGYAAYISEKLENSELIVERKIVGVEYMEKYYSENEEIWQALQRMIALDN